MKIEFKDDVTESEIREIFSKCISEDEKLLLWGSYIDKRIQPRLKQIFFLFILCAGMIAQLVMLFDNIIFNEKNRSSNFIFIFWYLGHTFLFGYIMYILIKKLYNSKRFYYLFTDKKCHYFNTINDKSFSVIDYDPKQIFLTNRKLNQYPKKYVLRLKACDDYYILAQDICILMKNPDDDLIWMPVKEFQTNMFVKDADEISRVYYDNPLIGVMIDE